MHNLTGLSSESNCPGKRRNLPRHAQGAAHAPTGNRLSTEPAMGGNRQCNPVLQYAEDKRLKQGQHNNWIEQIVISTLKECGETANVQSSNFPARYFVTWRNASSVSS